MNAPSSLSKELVAIPTEGAMEIFTSKDGEKLEPFLRIIREHIDAWVPPSLDTAKGRKEVASFAYRIVQSKAALEKAGEALAAEAKAIPKKIDANRRMVRETLDAWRDEVRRPLDDWEAAEKARVDKHAANIAWYAETLAQMGSASAASLKDALSRVRDADFAPYEEFETDYLLAQKGAIERLMSLLDAREKYEAEQAELAELRRQAAERKTQEAEAARLKAIEDAAARAAERGRLRAEADARAELDQLAAEAQRERDAAARRELELKLAAEAAARQALETERRLKDEVAAAARRGAETEARLKQKAADEAARAAKELADREADKTHRAAVNRRAAQALVAGGLSDEIAKLVVTLIAKKTVPAVSISY